MSIYATLAQAFRYPSPGQLARLEQMDQDIPAGMVKSAFQTFLSAIRSLDLSAWEELYTRTWDLSPLCPPYVGFQVWGEDYRRGVFLAHLQTVFQPAGIDTAGELPDHLVPVLEYLATAGQPDAELVEVFGKAAKRMAATLQKRDAENAYRPLLQALAALEPASGEEVSHELE